MRNSRNLAILMFFFVLSCAVVEAQMLERQTTTSLTSPSSTHIQVPPPPRAVQLTKPSGTYAVPYSISEYDYEAHMGFQRNEDALGNKIDVLGTELNGKLDNLKNLVDDDHTDITSLKETRSNWKGYMIAAGVIWTILATLTALLNKDKLRAWARGVLDISSGQS